MWFVLEGPDDTGKTTLALQLKSRGYVYQHADATDELPILAVRMARLIHARDVVWDRAHLGEFVHHPERADRKWQELIETILKQMDAQCYLFTMRYAGSWENSEDLHQDLVDKFIEAAQKSSLTWHKEWPEWG